MAEHLVTILIPARNEAGKIGCVLNGIPRDCRVEAISARRWSASRSRPERRDG